MLLFSALSLSGCSDSSTVANTEDKYAIGDLGGVSVRPREFVDWLNMMGILVGEKSAWTKSLNELQQVTIETILSFRKVS